MSFSGKGIPRKYDTILLKKSKNQVKTHSWVQGNNLEHLKTFKTTKNVDSFYKTYYKKYIINQVKKSITK